MPFLVLLALVWTGSPPSVFAAATCEEAKASVLKATDGVTTGDVMQRAGRIYFCHQRTRFAADAFVLEQHWIGRDSKRREILKTYSVRLQELDVASLQNPVLAPGRAVVIRARGDRIRVLKETPYWIYKGFTGQGEIFLPPHPEAPDRICRSLRFLIDHCPR
jgi:hypothetical protein